MQKLNRCCLSIYAKAFLGIIAPDFLDNHEASAVKKLVMLASFGLCGLSTVAVVQAQPEAAPAATMVTAPTATTTAMASTPVAIPAATVPTAPAATVTTAPVAAVPVVAKKPIPQDPPHVQRMIALYPDLIKRIAPYGNVCVQGKTCSVSVPVVAVASTGGAPKSGEEVYQGACTTCHSVGMLNSPKTGDKAAWAPRIAKGKETLYTHAINGFNAMPARGGGELSDQEVKNAVDYLVSKAQ